MEFIETLFSIFQLFWPLLKTFWFIFAVPIIAITLRAVITNRRKKKEADYLAKKIANEMKK